MSEWTTQQPTVDGYYWWRLNPADRDPEIVFVSGYEVTTVGLSHAWEMERHQGEWIGPLTIPK